jgi:drug/metabolite transporter (DMT)-like permease
MPAALESAVVMGSITALSGVLSLRDRAARPATLRERAWVAWMGVSDALNVLLFFAAYKITITVAVLTHYLMPVFVAVAAPLVLKEMPTRRTLFAVVASLSGLFAMLARSPGASGRAAVGWSAALGAASAAFYASNVIVNKFVIEAFSTSEVMFWHGVIATPLLAAFVPRQAWGQVSPHAILFLALVAAGPGAVAGLAFVWGLRRMPAAHASTLTLLEPVVAVLLGAAALGETPGWRGVAGAVLILGGAVAVMTQPSG